MDNDFEGNSGKKRKYFLFVAILAAMGFLFTIWTVVLKKNTSPTYIENPYLHFQSDKDVIYGIGVVIPKSDEVSITATESRKIEKILVKEGERVHQGALLIQLYNKDLIDEIRTREAVLEKAKIELNKQQSLPRKEDLLIQQALYSQALVDYQEAKRQQEMAQELFNKHAISRGELDQKNFTANLDKTKLDHAKALLDKVQAGAWNEDLQLAKSEVNYQQALLESAKQKLEETSIKAPIDATVLKINVKPGEVAFSNQSDPLMVIGNIDECYVEVSVDENEVAHLGLEKGATGFFRGTGHQPIPLTFLRYKPLVVPKKNLSGSVKERVDTKVLQVIYQFKEPTHCAYVGQFMDVFIPRADDKHE